MIDNARNAAKPVGAVLLLFYFCHLQVTSNEQISRPSSLLLHLHSFLILSHCRSPAWRESRFSACRGRCISTPEWIPIRMKLWSKCGWRWSLSHCCTPSPSTSCPASAPRTSAAPPIRTCMSEPQHAKPLLTSPVAAHPHVSSCRVKELSHHFSEMNPVRQKWIYTFFMYPFLSGDRVDGKPPAKLPSPLEAAAAVLTDFTYFKCRGEGESFCTDEEIWFSVWLHQCLLSLTHRNTQQDKHRSISFSDY